MSDPHSPRPLQEDAAWFALGRAFTYVGPLDPETAHAIVTEHRPLIEAAIRSAGTPPASTPEAFDAAGFAAVVVQRDRMTDMYGQCKAELAALRATPPEPVGGRVREAAAALVDEWDAAMAGDMPLNGHYQKQALDRLRSALQASPPTGVSDGALDVERLVNALLLVHSWDNYTAIAEARDIAREYQRLAREQADSGDGR